MSLFQILKRGNSRDEEYFSSSLSIILSEIPELTQYIIEKILEGKYPIHEYEVVLEDSFEEGRFDIVIKSMDFEIYIENKISSPLGKTQLPRYSKYLKNKPENTKLILLTRDFIDDTDITVYTDKYVFWSELYEIMEKFLNKNSKTLKDDKIYIIKQFLKFLEEENMSNEKVSWEYTKGIKSMMNLLNIIQTSLNRIRKEDEYIKKVSSSQGKDFAGYNINPLHFWVGIYYDEPNKIYFEYLESYRKRSKNTKKYDSLLKAPGGAPSKHYDFDKNYFLAFAKEEQKKAVYDFIKECIDFIDKK